MLLLSSSKLSQQLEMVTLLGHLVLVNGTKCLAQRYGKIIGYELFLSCILLPFLVFLASTITYCRD